MIRNAFTIILILSNLSYLFGQINYFPYVSDLKGKGDIHSVTLEEYEVKYKSDKLDSSTMLREECTYEFDNRGNIVTSKSIDVNSELILADSMVYDLSNNLILSYRYFPDFKTLESLEEIVYNSKGILVEKKLYGQNGKLSSTYTLIKQLDKYNKYTKKFKDGYSRTHEEFYDENNNIIKFIVSDNDSVLLYSTYQYNEKSWLIKENHHNSKSVIIANTIFKHDKNGKVLVEYKQNIGSTILEYKYETTYDKYGNSISDVNSFSNGTSNKFVYNYTYDNHGNWITQTVRKADLITGYFKRQIKYK